jgi:hypothetical protein
MLILFEPKAKEEPHMAMETLAVAELRSYPTDVLGALEERLREEWASVGYAAERTFEFWTPWMG